METSELSRKERGRLEVLGRVKRRELTLAKASALVGPSYRQMKRVYDVIWPRGIGVWCTGCGVGRL